VLIQSCKAENHFRCVSFHNASWSSKYHWTVFTFSKLWMNRRNVHRSDILYICTVLTSYVSPGQFS
jgi:hypothetical protein